MAKGSGITTREIAQKLHATLSDAFDREVNALVARPKGHGNIPKREGESMKTAFQAGMTAMRHHLNAMGVFVYAEDVLDEDARAKQDALDRMKVGMVDFSMADDPSERAAYEALVTLGVARRHYSSLGEINEKVHYHLAVDWRDRAQVAGVFP